MKVRYNKGMGCPVEISDGKTATCISLDAAKELQASLLAVIEQAENASEEELTEFENRLCEILDSAINYQIHSTHEETIEDAKKLTPELLALAREQFIKDGYVIEKKAFHDEVENISDKHRAEMSVEYSLHCKIEDGTRRAIMNWDTFQKVAQKFINIGKVEALKDLPRWRKCADCTPKPKYSNEWIFSIDSENVTRESAIVHKGYFLPLDGLEKLPGFKED